MQPMIDFFSDLLGFQVRTVLGKQPAFAMLSRDDNFIMLVSCPSIPWPHTGWTNYFWEDDVDTFALEKEGRGA